MIVTLLHSIMAHSLMPAVQDVVVVEGVGIGVGFPSKMSQAHYLVKVVK